MPEAPWEWVNPIKDSQPTGKWRTRAQKLTGKLILQLELEHTHFNHLDSKKKTTAITHGWQDANAETVVRFRALVDT